MGCLKIFLVEGKNQWMKGLIDLYVERKKKKVKRADSYTEYSQVGNIQKHQIFKHIIYFCIIRHLRHKPPKFKW